MAQVAQSDPHPVLERAAEPATAGDNPTNPNPPTSNFPHPDRQRPPHFANLTHDPHLHYPPQHQHQHPLQHQHQHHFPDHSHYDPKPLPPDHHPLQSQHPHSSSAPDPSPSEESQPEDIAQPGTTNPSDPALPEQPKDDYPQHDSPTTASPDLPPPVPPAMHAPQPQPNPAVVGLVASFGDMSLGGIPYGATPPMPMLGPVMPMVAPQIPAHQQRHHHHPHQMQHPHMVNQPTTYQLWVPQERVGAVIGGHGTVIRSLQERSGATIQVHNDTVRGDRKLFTIFGTLAQYDIAKQLINDIVEKPRHGHVGGHAGSHLAPDRPPYSPVGDHGPRSGELWKTVYVPTNCVGLVIGRNGETIRNLQDRSGADIKVTPDEEAQPGADTRSILISGTDEAISTAHQLVSEIVMDAKSRRPPHSGPQVGTSVNGQPIVIEVLAVPNEKVGLIIGKKGAAIRDLQMKSGAKIQVTKDDSSVQSDGTRPVTLTGMRANVDEAKAMIANKINMPRLQSSTVGTTYNSPPPQAGPSVTSPGGPSQPVSAFIVPNMYEPAYQNGQQPFQQVYESNDPSAQNRAMAYFQYIGYNNYIAQQRQFQSQMPMHYPHAQQQQQQPEKQQQQGINTPQQEQQDAMGQPSQYPSPPMQQGQQLEGIQGSPGMVHRDANGNVLMYPSHHYQHLPPHPGGHQMYASGPPNARMYPRREQVQAAQAHAQMLMQAHAHAHAQAQSQVHQAQAQVHAHAQAQAQAQAEADAQAESQTRQQAHQPSISTPPEDNEQAHG